MIAGDCKRRIREQLALDYCCTPQEAADRENHFTIYEPRKGRRRFEERSRTFLKAVSYRNKLLFTGDEKIIEWCRSKFGNMEAAWFMEPGPMRELDRELEKYGYGIDKIHPFFVPRDEILENRSLNCENDNSGNCGYEVRLYRGDEIEVFRGDRRFGYAFSFCETAPDVIGAAAVREGEILGMAGASADSDTFWQIGIDITQEARGLGIGKALVTRLRDEILKCDKVPYYGTAVSHTLSQNIAVLSGFRPAWTELTTTDSAADSGKTEGD